MAAIALLPKSAPVWLCGLCALGAAAAGAAIKSLLEAAYWSRRWAGLDLPPVVKEGKQPILGHISKIFDQSFLQECRDTHGPVFSLELPLLSRHPVPVIHGAPEVHELLGSENDLVLSSWPTGVTELLGEKSLLATHGDEHKRLRQVGIRQGDNPLFSQFYSYRPLYLSIAFCAITITCGLVENGHNMTRKGTRKDIIGAW